MPTLDVTELNIVLGVLGAFVFFYGIISIKLKRQWYLGEALPAVVLGICLGPIAANFLDSERWGSAEKGQTSEITLGVTRVVIGVQLVIAGFQLPAKFLLHRWRQMVVLLIPVMALMWLATTVCVLATVPKVTPLAALVMASAVTCTDPILSQAVAKGPFADRFVARPLREIISAEAGANDGFGFPFLMLATELLRHAADFAPETHAGTPPMGEGVSGAGASSSSSFSSSSSSIARRLLLLARAEGDEAGGTMARVGGGVGAALASWLVDTWLYGVLMSMAYGAVVGYGSLWAIKYALRRRWIDEESYLLFPTGLGLFLVGTCGALGTNDLLVCAVAGNALNWDGEYLAETERRHDEVNSCVDVLLNFGGFMYIGTIIPWGQFHDPDGTGLTYGRLFALGFLVLVFRRIPAILALYRLMPDVVANVKEALFMGYFGPIGIGAVFYVEHTRTMYPADNDQDPEVRDLLAALGPAIYFLVLFSIFVHGLSIPVLNFIYGRMGVRPVTTDAVEIHRRSANIAAPANAVEGDDETFIAYNRFSRPTYGPAELPVIRIDAGAGAGAGADKAAPGTRRSTDGGSLKGDADSIAEEKLHARAQALQAFHA